LAAQIPVAVCVWDVEGATVRYINAAWTSLTGRPLSAGDDLGRILEGVHGADRNDVLHALGERPRGGVDLEHRVVRPDGGVRWVRAHTVGIHNATGRLYCVACLMDDITERKDANARLLNLAHYDALTGLPNRPVFVESLKKALDQARIHRWTVSVLFVDLDRFKRVNDTLGHAAGDELLRQLSTRLLTCLRIRDTVGRFGGDEFALVLVTTGPAQAAGAVAKKISHVLRQPFSLAGREATITASIGIAVDAAGARSPTELIEDADAAMYCVKRAGGDGYTFYAGKAVEPSGRPLVPSFAGDERI
jgi:diguanylate cyclase (GGDEF)-like protein/PAS domain S-box-containing protein